MNREESAGFYVKIPISRIQFADPLEQRKLEMRLAEDKDKSVLLREIEEIICQHMLEIAT